jgi:hypothetical protein
VRSGLHAFRWLVRLLILIGIAFSIDAVSKVLSPSPPTVGLFRGITDFAIAVFGPRGVSINSFISAFACFYLARSFWRGAADKPTDRLWW